MNGGDDLLRVDPLEVGAGGREVRVPELALEQRQWDPFMEQFDSVGMAELVLVPTSAQPPLSRPARCADVCRKSLLRSDKTSESVGIFRSLRDGHKRDHGGDRRSSFSGQRVGAVDRQRLLGHVGVQPYVGCRDLLAAQAENVNRDVVRRCSRSF
jgi:hypothetical protein